MATMMIIISHKHHHHHLSLTQLLGIPLGHLDPGIDLVPGCHAGKRSQAADQRLVPGAHAAAAQRAALLRGPLRNVRRDADGAPGMWRAGKTQGKTEESRSFHRELVKCDFFLKSDDEKPIVFFPSTYLWVNINHPKSGETSPQRPWR